MFSAGEAQPQDEDVQVIAPKRRVIRPAPVGTVGELAGEVNQTGSASQATVPTQEMAANGDSSDLSDPLRAFIARRLGSLNSPDRAPQVNPDMERNARLQPALANFAGAIDQLGGAAPKAWVASDVASRDLKQRQDMANFLAQRVKDKDLLAGKLADIESGTGRQAYNQAELARRVKADADRAQAAEAKRLTDAEALAKRLEAKRLEDEAKTRRAGVAAGMKKEAADIKKADALAASRVGYNGETYEPEDGVPLASPVLNAAVKLAGDAGGARAAMKRLRTSLNDAISSPEGSEKRQAAQANLSIAATALNAALGQGAMASDEFRRVKESLGEVSGLEYMTDVVKRLVSGDASSASRVLARIDASIPMLDEITKEKLKAARLKVMRGGNAGSGEAWPVGEVRTDKNGTKFRKREDGKLEVVK